MPRRRPLAVLMLQSRDSGDAYPLDGQAKTAQALAQRAGIVRADRTTRSRASDARLPTTGGRTSSETCTTTVGWKNRP